MIEEGRRKKEEGRRKKAEGRRSNTISQKLFYILLSRGPTPNPSQEGEWGSGGVNPPLTPPRRGSGGVGE
ncbi:hypothetical protein [Okeania sp. SIO2B3]|uniref:hypothetical protein n=1 Tax=Okeania sp. SIO2B3 TaxID=2607784 RepID=UPI0013C00660|nr:hypothetical protein [Okeania sp. SIO2B3]NET43621.1 hypothetical protein [Okeania sp. SIO2B3]